MKKIVWRQHATCELAAEKLGIDLGKLLEKRQEQKILLLLSGGSSLNILPHIKMQNWQGITVGMLDERFDQTNENSNFLQLEKTEFYFLAKKAGATFVDSKTQVGDSLEALGERVEKSLEFWQKNNPEGEIVAVFGMGADGHIAGIFPYQDNAEFFEKFFDRKNIVVAYDAETRNVFPQRVTTTFALHRTIKKAFVFVCGTQKQIALEKLKVGKVSKNQLPAMIFHQMPDVEIVTDLNLK
jgi:6-phosphogluconolactonase/glucosamine-6-phosphate isomerase/deaminase